MSEGYVKSEVYAVTERRLTGPSDPIPGVPIRELSYRSIVNDSGDGSYVNRLMIGTATTGLVRIEWVNARYGQIIPVNWSMVTMQQFINSYIPLRYQVADAQNLIVGAALEQQFEWLLLWEHDVLPPIDAMVRLNAYMRRPAVPVVSGLYFTRSVPAEPLVFRGRGTSYYEDWYLGDRVWCDGVPTGFLLVHCGVLRAMWEDSPEYVIKYGPGVTTRAVFETPRHQWTDPAETNVFSVTGTSDLDWCTRVIEGDYLRKAGWGDFVDALPDQKNPFLVDTNICCTHIEPDGRQFPSAWELGQWRNNGHGQDTADGAAQVEDAPPTLGVAVGDSMDLGESYG